MNNLITKEKLSKYSELTSKALGIVKKKIIKDKQKEAKEIIEMASNYLSDSKHFESKGEFVDAFAALNYVHGWIDAGVRLGIFDVDDDKLFTIR
jgi:hypothetical protein